MANKAYKFRIYPDDEQKILFARTFGCVRMVYNHWLDRKIRQYEKNKTNVTYTACAKEMAELKKTEEYAFLKEVDSVSLQQSLRHLDTAFTSDRRFRCGQRCRDRLHRFRSGRFRPVGEGRCILLRLQGKR